jgi:NhaA family Na+:H+ antiporter
MVVPALCYAALNAGGDGARGWGIPMATDIAMAVGVLSLLGRRVAPSLRVFLLALAIVDDIGAIVVIAIFYGTRVDAGALAVAAGLCLGVLAMRAAGVRFVLAYAAVGVAMWLALHESGVSATLAGVVMGLMAPTRPSRPGATVSVVERLEHLLHPWTSFLIVPLFALANAGVPLSASALSAAASSPITLGVMLGLVVGKPVGVAGAAWLAVRVRAGALPEDANWPDVVGIAALAGIGFTVSIFVTGLAFGDVALQDQAKVGILAGSLFSAIAGSLIVHRRHRRHRRRTAA